jgi:hypothetical protein
MTGSELSWIPIVQGYCSAFVLDLGIVLAQEGKLRIREILKAAAVVSGREGWDEHARRGGKGGMVVVEGRDAEKKETSSQPSGRPEDKLTDADIR